MGTVSGATDGRRAARAREITLHAALLACCVWAIVAADVISPGPSGRYSGFRKGNDFVQFYVYGALARESRFGALVDPAQFREAQRPYFAPGADAAFPPVYGPQVALLFAPLAALPYLWAYAVWSALTLALVLWSASVCRRHTSLLQRWRAPVVASTLAYPPLGYLILDGQLSGLAAAPIALSLRALQAGSKPLAGAALGLLGYKVSLLGPAVAVCLIAREWRMGAAAITVGLLQLGIATPIAGIDVVWAHVENTLGFARSPDALSRNPYLMASWRTFWFALLPPAAAWPAYLFCAAASVGAAAWGWSRRSSPLKRLALISLAIVLAAPHCYFYDLVILMPAFVVSADLLMARRALTLRWCAWLAYFAPVAAPLAAATHVQPVTLVLFAWLVVLAGFDSAGAAE